MPKFSKVRFTPAHKIQPGKQIQQNGYHTTPESQQPGVSYSQRPGEQIQQNGNHTTPESHSLNGSKKFRVPARPFPQEVPTTPMPTIPAAPMSGMLAPPRPYTQPAIVDPHTQERVKNYADWLAKLPTGLRSRPGTMNSMTMHKRSMTIFKKPQRS